MRRGVLTLILAFAVHSGPAFGQTDFGDSDAPIFVEADKATYRGEMTLLEGKVDVKQGTAHIQSDAMEIYREKREDDETIGLSLGAVTRIVAIGNFVYRTPDDVVRGDRGVYNRQTGIITVTGNVSVGQPGSSRLSGDRLVYDLNTKRARIGDGTGRVNFSVNQDKD